MLSMKLKIAAAMAVATFVAGSLWYAYDSGKDAGMAQVQAKWDRERAAMISKMALEVELARSREAELQAKADQITKEKAREIAALNRRHAAALDSLRNRPERPASGAVVPPTAGDTDARAGCTGSGLYRDDAALLVGLARLADETRLHLAQCQAAYAAARNLLNGMADAKP